MYDYHAIVLSVIDGDTVKLFIDMGIRHWERANCRMAKINAPELKSLDPETRAKAEKSKEFLADLLAVNIKTAKPVYIISERLDNYGRPIVTIYTDTTKSLNINQLMIESGHAVPYM